jgi:hypothetical protein
MFALDSRYEHEDGGQASRTVPSVPTLCFENNGARAFRRNPDPSLTGGRKKGQPDISGVAPLHVPRLWAGKPPGELAAFIPGQLGGVLGPL